MNKSIYKLAELESKIQRVLEDGPWPNEPARLCGALVEVIGAECDCCKKTITGEAEVSGFGGINNPRYFFTCIPCRERSNAAFEASNRDVDIHQSQPNDY